MERHVNDVHEHELEEIKKLAYLIVVLSLIVMLLFGLEGFV